jgi:hypothetical protein
VGLRLQLRKQQAEAGEPEFRGEAQRA